VTARGWQSAPVTLRSLLRTSPNGRFSGLPLGRLPGPNVRLRPVVINDHVPELGERQLASYDIDSCMMMTYQQDSGFSTGFVHMGLFTSF